MPYVRNYYGEDTSEKTSTWTFHILKVLMYVNFTPAYISVSNVFYSDFWLELINVKFSSLVPFRTKSMKKVVIFWV